MRCALLLGLLLTVACQITVGASTAPPAAPRLFGAAQLAVIVNDSDPLSVRIGQYYQRARGIPAQNMVHVNFPAGNPGLSPREFNAVKAQVDKQTPAQVQAYALTWAAPYRVGCMSITTAFAAGYDKGFCAKGCKPTRASPYYDSDSRTPYTSFGWRPAMALAGDDFDQVRALIERGVAADGTYPAGTGYLLSTSDKARNVRALVYPAVVRYFGSRVRLEEIQANSLTHRQDVLFYFTGLKQVPDIDMNRYLPGAIADHLTSSGGRLTDSRQMSSLAWLRAGATGSYGTVVEPCAFPQKFPNPGVVLQHYLNGETLIESYWKSVAWPGQGIFIGEPLARPFAFIPIPSWATHGSP